ncbi:hypothetical protein PRNP1_012900 [Phytophthora ramorum]
MRLMLWVLLVTVVTLLASTDAADTTTTSKLESIEAPGLLARALSPEYIADGKRSLRVRGNVDATDDDESYIGDNNEERAISIASTLDSMKAYMGQLRNSLSGAVIKKTAERRSRDQDYGLVQDGRNTGQVQNRF